MVGFVVIASLASFRALSAAFNEQWGSSRSIETKGAPGEEKGCGVKAVKEVQTPGGVGVYLVITHSYPWAG